MQTAAAFFYGTTSAGMRRIASARSEIVSSEQMHNDTQYLNQASVE